MTERNASPRVAYVSLGCRVNRVETDSMVGELIMAGCEVADERDAQVVVVNTCAVTGEAQTKTRKALRHAATLPQKPLVIATGCVANLFAQELEAIAPNVVVEPDKTAVARRALQAMGLQPGQLDASHMAVPSHGHEAITPTGRTRAGVKVQDGCDLRCSYCIVWKARGHSRSVDVAEVTRLVAEAHAEGTPEVMLTGINLGRYRCEGPAGAMRLPQLIDHLLEHTDVQRLRLGSIEPQDVDEELVRVMAASQGRVAPYVHLCLQSGCDETLARMGRIYRTDLFAQRVDLVREALPHAAMETDLIVGFPGETDEEFLESLDFCERMFFSHVHVFRYSKRPGTPAAVMAGQVNPKTKAARAQRMRDLSKRMHVEQAKALVGTRDLVAVQAPGSGVTGGLFEATVTGEAPVGSLVPVEVLAAGADGTLACAASS